MTEIISNDSFDGLFLRQTISSLIQHLKTGSLQYKNAKQAGMKKIIKNYLFHPNTELFFQLEGKTEFNFPEERIILAPGEQLIIPPGLPHMEKLIKINDKFLTLVITCTKNRTNVHLSAQEVSGHPTISYSESFQQLPPSPTEDLCLKIVDTANLTPKAQVLVRTGYTLSLLGLIEYFLSNPPPRSKENRTVREIKHLVQSRYQEPSLTVKELAKHTNYSTDYLSFLFHKESGITLNSFIKKIRLSHAKTLLKESNYTISEISWLCGFNTASYFSRVFTNNTEKSPKEYRKQYFT